MAGFRWAYGVGATAPNMTESDVSSAFSEGDLLLVIGSKVSGQATLMATDTYAVACADSLDSVNGKVPVVLPEAGDVFLSSLTPAGSLITIGTAVDVEVDGGGRHYCGASANTAVLVMVGTPLEQSSISKVYCKILYANIDLA